MNSKVLCALFLVSSLLAGTTMSHTSLASAAGQEKPLLIPKSGGFVTEEEITDDSTGLIIDPPREESDATSNDGQKEYLLKIPPKLLEVEKIKDPVKKLGFIFQDLEQNGKVPPKTTQTMMAAMNGDREALKGMCEIIEDKCGIELSQDSSGEVPLVDLTAVAVGVITYLLEKAWEWFKDQWGSGGSTVGDGTGTIKVKPCGSQLCTQ